VGYAEKVSGGGQAIRQPLPERQALRLATRALMLGRIPSETSALALLQGDVVEGHLAFETLEELGAICLPVPPASHHQLHWRFDASECDIQLAIR
jgi:hypothetical protein